jgi:hypothetical protein
MQEKSNDDNKKLTHSFAANFSTSSRLNSNLTGFRRGAPRGTHNKLEIADILVNKSSTNQKRK